MIRRILILLLLMIAAPLQAHETTRSYVTLTRDGASVTARIEVAFRDIEVPVWIDADLDGALTWGEVTQRFDAIDHYLLAGLTLDAGGPCTLSHRADGVAQSSGTAYLVLEMAGSCPDAKAPLRIRSTLFADIDPGHRLFLTARAGTETTTTLLSASSPEVTLTTSTASLAATFADYFQAGMAHLLGGPDHLLFLLALILPAICAGTGMRRAVLAITAAVTGFTLAHALSLTAALTELLRPPSALIEILIAVTILVTVADNLRPFIPVPRTAMAAFFGVIHGFGFASALGVLDLSGGSFAVALLGFNLGIEAAQIAVVLVLVPALTILGHRRPVLWAGSGLAGVASLWWIWLRVTTLAAA